MTNKNLRSCGTHDGTFHADEVTACALLIIFGLIDQDKIVRTREHEDLEKCEYVCDVGGLYEPSKKLFDHHQVEYQGPLSSAGMILTYLKDQKIISEKEYIFFKQTMMDGVDAHDNGLDPQTPGLSTYSHVISSYTPIPQDVGPEEMNKAFFQALEFAKGYLARIHKKFNYLQESRELVSEAMKKQDICLMFDKNIPWLEIFFEMGGVNHPAKFLIMPSGNHWKLRGIPPTYEDRMKVREPLPLEWAGHLDEDLKKITGMPGAIFCHKGRFISVWETKEDAIKALQYVLSKMKR